IVTRYPSLKHSSFLVFIGQILLSRAFSRKDFGKHFMLDYPGEYIAVLSAGSHEFLVKDQGRNAGDKAVFPSGFDSADLRGIFIAGENFLGASGIKASFTCNGDKRIMVTDFIK